MAGEASSMQLVVLTAAEITASGDSGGIVVFPLLPRRRAEGKSESDQFYFWSSNGLQRELVGWSVCVANMVEVSWLKMKMN